MTTMFKKAVLIVLAIAGLFSCQQFFTTSLGVPFARNSADRLPATLDSTNLPSVLDAASIDPELALAVLEALPALIEAAATEEEQLELIQASMKAAESSSGIGTAILGIATGMLDSLFGATEEGAEELDFETMFDEAEEVFAALPYLKETATALALALPDPDTAADLYASLVEATDIETLAFTAITLILSEAVSAEQTLVEYTSAFDPNDPENTQEEQLAVSLMTSVVEQFDVETDSALLGTILSLVGLGGEIELPAENP